MYGIEIKTVIARSLSLQVFQMKSAALGLAEESGAKLSHILIETSPRQESEKTASFLAWLGFKSTRHLACKRFACM